MKREGLGSIWARVWSDNEVTNNVATTARKVEETLIYMSQSKQWLIPYWWMNFKSYHVCQAVVLQIHVHFIKWQMLNIEKVALFRETCRNVSVLETSMCFQYGSFTSWQADQFISPQTMYSIFQLGLHERDIPVVMK